MIDPLLLSVTKVATYSGEQPLTNASGFFFSRGSKLFVVTSRHVLWDETNEHFPDSIRIELHTDEENVAQATDFSIPLYQNEQGVWRQGNDATGVVDVAAIEIDRRKLPKGVAYRSFSMDHLIGNRHVDVGTSLLVIGFPLGFYDTLHRLPVARHAIMASCYDLRFQGEGYFLTDARTHRGMSGAPVVMRADADSELPEDFSWMLAGIHSARLDIGPRDLTADEALGLNCAWFSDILMTLTDSKESSHKQ